MSPMAGVPSELVDGTLLRMKMGSMVSSPPAVSCGRAGGDAGHSLGVGALVRSTGTCDHGAIGYGTTGHRATDHREWNHRAQNNRLLDHRAYDHGPRHNRSQDHRPRVTGHRTLDDRPQYNRSRGHRAWNHRSQGMGHRPQYNRSLVSSDWTTGHGTVPVDMSYTSRSFRLFNVSHFSVQNGAPGRKLL